MTDILTRRAGTQASGAPPWLSLFEEPPPGTPALCRAGSPSPPRRPWGRPRTLSLDAKLSSLKGRGSRRAHPPRPSPPGSGSSSGSASPAAEHDRPASPRPLQSQV